ncbi:hypothetical protein HK096_003613 [Nowakowskiella sp. JEL0078]|nr:hypothetical protein HK096_003613 [Nowakowskiella sp. JEL0078]
MLAFRRVRTSRTLDSLLQTRLFSSSANVLKKQRSSEFRKPYMKLSPVSPIVASAVESVSTIGRRRPSEHRAFQVQKNLLSLKREPLAPAWVFSSGNYRMSPKKLNLVARMIRKMPIEEAKIQLKLSPKRAAVRVLELIKRAEHNLRHNNGITEVHRLIIKQAWVGKGFYLKRINPHGRGRFGIIMKPHSHVKILFELPPEVKIKDAGIAATYEERLEKKKSDDFQQILGWVKNRKLYVPLPDHHSLRFGLPPWSSKPWKYISSEKWKGSENALMRGMRSQNNLKVKADHWRRP